MAWGDGTNDDQPHTTLADILRNFLREMAKSKPDEAATEGIMTVLTAFSKTQLVQAVAGLSKEEQDKLAPLTPGLFGRDKNGNIVPDKAGTEEDPKNKALQDIADILNKGKSGVGDSFDVDTQSELYKRGKISSDEFRKRLSAAGAKDQDINDVLSILDDDKGTYQGKLLADKQNTSDKLAQRAFEVSHQMTDGSGNGSRFNQKPGVDLILSSLADGQYDRNMAKTKLMNQEGYTEQDAESLLQLSEHGGDSKGGGGGGGSGGGRGSNTNTQTTRHTTHYVDVPSAAEFLDDFRNGFATHLKTMPNLGPDVAMWAIDNMEFFLNDYLGTLGQMAQKGQNPWVLAGDWDKSDSSTSNSVSTTTPNAPSAGGGGGGGSGGGGGAAPGAPTSVDTSSTTDSETLAKRERPTQVASLSPSAYLGSAWNGPQIRTLYEGQRGARAAQSRSGGGQVARRL